MADAYEAMTSDRVYREAIGVAAARKELRDNSGKQFDSRVVEAFLVALEQRASAETPITPPLSG